MRAGSRHPRSVIDVKYSINCLAQIWRLLHTLQKGSVYLLWMDYLLICMTTLVLPPLLGLLFFIVIHCVPPQQDRKYFHFPVLTTSHCTFLTNSMNSFRHQFCLVDVWGTSNWEREHISPFLWSGPEPWTDHCGICTGSLDRLPLAMENSKCLLQIWPVKLS